MSFPSSPYDGEIYTNILGLQYIYNAADGKWLVNGSPISFTGTQGLTGPIGATGIQGTTGSQGQTGAQGYQGTTGLRGLTGYQGATGIAGAKGETGALQTIYRNGETINFVVSPGPSGWVEGGHVGDHRTRLPFTILDWHVTQQPAGQCKVWITNGPWNQYPRYTAMYAYTGPFSNTTYNVFYDYAFTGPSKFTWGATGMDSDILSFYLENPTGIKHLTLSMHLVDYPCWSTGLHCQI